MGKSCFAAVPIETTFSTVASTKARPLMRPSSVASRHLAAVHAWRTSLSTRLDVTSMISPLFWISIEFRKRRVFGTIIASCSSLARLIHKLGDGSSWPPQTCSTGVSAVLTWRCISLLGSAGNERSLLSLPTVIANSNLVVHTNHLAAQLRKSWTDFELC
jgi:hypothetical protein